MFRRRSRGRRLQLGVAVATCSIVLMYGGSASAALNLNTSTDTNISIDGDTHSFQGNLRPVTRDGFQYFAYWDAADPVDGENYLTLTRRDLSDNSLVTLRFDGTGGSEAWSLESTAPWDGHNYVGLGLSPNDGRIHLSWSLHTGDRVHRYVRSATGCMTQREADFTFANCRFERRTSQSGSALERSMTYPTYFNDSRDRLYFAYRYDASSRGDEILNSYNDDGTWTNRGAILRGRNPARDRRYNYTFDPDGAGPERDWTAIERGVYIQEWAFDSRDRLHALWVWRDNAGGLVTQHGLHYAYSDDFGGTWYYENSGRTGQIGTAETDPITIVDLAQTQVVALPPGWGLGSSGFELDSNGNPHAVLSASDTQSADQGEWYNRQKHIWRTSDKQWHQQFIEERTDVRKGQANLPGGIFFDKADNAYAIFARNNVDWIPYNRDAYRQTELPYENVTWQADGERDGVLDVRLYSSYSCLQNTDNVNMTIETRGNAEVRVNMANNTDATDVTISWTTTAALEWSSTRMQTFRSVLRRDASYRTYTFRITDADWRGTLNALEVCLAEGDPDDRGDQQIDWMDIYDPTARRTARVWEFTAPIRMYAAEASQADNWATWNVEELFPGDGVYVTGQDGYWFQDAQRYIDSGRVELNLHQQGSPGREILSLRSFDFVSDDVIKDWRFDADAMGWTGINHVREFAWTDDRANRRKGIGATITGNDSALLSQVALDTTISNGRYIHVVLRNESEARTARVWFRTAADRTWTVGKSQSVAITPRSGYTDYSIDMNGVTGWDRSLLYQLELDPADDAGVTRGSFVVDRIYINNTR